MEQLIFFAVIAVVVASEVAYLISLALKDASIADVFWGLYFTAIVGAVTLFGQTPSSIQSLVSVLVSVWGFRLAWHIAKRKVGKPEDWRYMSARKKWGKSFAIRSYFTYFLFQALLALVISAPVIIAANAGANVDSLKWWQYVGLTIWLVGFGFEVISDWQLAQFLKKKHGGNALMISGLWKYSRHPNYFGEVTQWWGLWLLVLGLPYGWVAIISPITITFLILFVSGVPLLELKYKNNEKYQSYARVTSIFFPLPPKKGRAA